MPRVYSLHSYSLKPDVSPSYFQNRVKEAEQAGLFELPGLIRYHFLRGIKGEHQGGYAALWVYESVQSWEALWGPLEAPVGPEQYPEPWKRWEREFLRPLLIQNPDRITFTAYEEWLQK